MATIAKENVAPLRGSDQEVDASGSVSPTGA
jgi:hypothetical protein